MPQVWIFFLQPVSTDLLYSLIDKLLNNQSAYSKLYILYGDLFFHRNLCIFVLYIPSSCWLSFVNEDLLMASPQLIQLYACSGIASSCVISTTVWPRETPQ